MRKLLLVVVCILLALTTVSALTAPEMVLVKAGGFQKEDTGPKSELFSWMITDDPKVEIAYDFEIGQYEITNEQFLEFLNDAKIPSSGYLNKRRVINMDSEYCEFLYQNGKFTLKRPQNKNYPVIEVSRWGAVEYCNWLSEKNGLAKAYDSLGQLLDVQGKKTEEISQVEGYRLPTEAEWEYAARGGHKSTQDYPFAGHTDMGYVGWYAYNSGEKEYAGLWEPAFVEELDMKTHEVGQKMPNELGLYDMSGNVWEWCHDGYGRYTFETRFNPIGLENASTKVLRGGSWYSYAEYCRAANRNHSLRDNKSFGIGFRVVRTRF